VASIVMNSGLDDVLVHLPAKSKFFNLKM